jgi:hypothetical protein
MYILGCNGLLVWHGQGGNGSAYKTLMFQLTTQKGHNILLFRRQTDNSQR